MGTHYEGSAEEISTLNVFIKLMRASESINSRLSRHLSDNNLTVTQFGTLEVLLHLGSLNQKEIGEKLLKSGGNITMVIDNLEKRGFVNRDTDPHDGRAVIISLTDEGREFIEGFFPRHLEKISEEFSVLNEDEKAMLAKLCKKLGTRRQG